MEEQFEQGPKLLIVDDDSICAKHLQKAIEEYCAQVRVIAVPGPRKALEVLGETNFDLIVTDYLFSDYFDGIREAQCIRKKGVNTRIVIWTGGVNEFNPSELEDLAQLKDVQLESKSRIGAERIIRILKGEYDKRRIREEGTRLP